MKHRIRYLNSLALRRRQNGLVLLIALVAMVVLTLAGVSLMRVVDSSLTLAGNLSYRQASMAATDVGVNAAVAWLVQQPAATLEQHSQANGYLATMPPEPNWTDAGSWPAASTVNLAGPNGNTVSYQIFRLCTLTGPANAVNQLCNTAMGAGGAGANSKSAGAIQFQGNLVQFYRVVVRAVGPRNSSAYVQVMVSR